MPVIKPAKAGQRQRFAKTLAGVMLVASGGLVATPVAAGNAEVVPVGTAGSGTPSNSRATEVNDAGYTEAEYFISGDAQIYSGSSAGPAVATGESVPYTTRILVRAPQPEDFSGRVMVEPFNTSGTGDVDAAWGMIGDRLLDNGDVWIGVTVRNSSVGVLLRVDGTRYAPMTITSNGQAWDMLTQVAELVRSRSDTALLPEFRVRRVYMTGYSQSAVDASTYANAINPLAHQRGKFVYDGYLIMGRSASSTPLESGIAVLPKLEIRPIGKATSPIIEVESQSDVEGFDDPAYTNPGGASVRRADSDAKTDRFRLYEIPGASHAPRIPGCDHEGTTFPLKYLERAALTNLYRWVENAKSPPRAPRIKLASADVVSQASVDANGNAEGGVRSPFLDTALARYQAHDTPGPLCALAGAEIPLDSTALDALYPTVDDYIRAFTRDLDRAITKRFLLRADRAEILAAAKDKAEALLHSAS
ncbi:MAG: hypothetical protein EXQ79_05470 [Acidimicrobiia bacterium]|nr:hypothetical protein [Acidimicrobiia bacterium]